MISETKIDDIFPHSQFLIEDYSTQYRLVRDSNGGGILFYVKEYTPSNSITIENKPIETFFIELNMRNGKWLINCSYNPHKSLIGNHFNALSKHFDLHSLPCENVIISGDFNVDTKEKHMKCFCDNHNLKSLIKQPACCKKPDCPT